MILGVVGTHHAPMTRLVEALDTYAATHTGEPVVIQAGPLAGSTRHAESVPFMDEGDLRRASQRARIVVTHGGPSLLLQLIDADRVPIVMPREKRYREHVDDHQVDFASFLQRRQLVVVSRTELELLAALDQYELMTGSLRPNSLPAADPIRAGATLARILQGNG